MTTIVQLVEEKGFDISNDEAKEYLTLGAGASKVSRAIKGGYFRLLATRAHKEGSVTKAHRILYPIVTSVYTTPSMTGVEKNKATNFARSAYSTLLKTEQVRGLSAIDPAQSKEYHRGLVKRVTAPNWYELWNAEVERVRKLLREVPDSATRTQAIAHLRGIN